jgi:hypothetical protein
MRKKSETAKGKNVDCGHQHHLVYPESPDQFIPTKMLHLCSPDPHSIGFTDTKRVKQPLRVLPHFNKFASHSSERLPEHTQGDCEPHSADQQKENVESEHIHPFQSNSVSGTGCGTVERRRS